MPRSINDRDIVFLGLKLPQGDIDGDTTLTLGFEFVQDPGIFEGTFAHLKITRGGGARGGGGLI